MLDELKVLHNLENKTMKQTVWWNKVPNFQGRYSKWQLS